ncbi:hypothetical protein [Mycobacterium mantenii]|uniref:DNA phosphorothioation-dependent restriction protein DptG n=1 Tax=Mycobacterium mantenii TaxID=560555 RepID=A0A1A2T9Q0_MYCNT|nr:hypothetical protein [Mycobacterium mantenii]OBH47310.1 hypothetical protein A5688_03130 [Mycobacterium mantenii]OBH73129.1 hypothetical protein A5683_25250 [Mycobacterium mantenii]
MSAALADVAAATGVGVEWEPGEPAKSPTTLFVAGHRIELPRLWGERQELLGTQGFVPTVPRADDRDKLLWRIYQEASADPTPDRWPNPPLDLELEEKFRAELPLPPGEVREAVADALVDRFYSRKQARVLLPLQAVLPANYAHSTRTRQPARYRMFSGILLPFLLWDEPRSEFDRDLMDRVLRVIDGNSDLTRLDELLLDVASATAANPEAVPNAESLLNKYGAAIRADMSDAGGPFCAPALARFRRDLDTVLSTDLPRSDKVAWLTLLISLHIGLWMYRGALVKGAQLDAVIAAAADVAAPEVEGCHAHRAGCDPTSLRECPMAGAIEFRTGTGRYEPIRLRDGARSSYASLDQRWLHSLPATLITLNLATLAWSGLRNAEATTIRDVTPLVSQLRVDAEFRKTFDAACAAIAVIHHAAHRGPAALRHELADAGQVGRLRPGVYALREDVLRLRRRDLRHQSRDILNQLLFVENTGAGSLINRNGNIAYYEIDERLLQLLVRLVCRDDPVPLAEFLLGLKEYGLVPQSPQERNRLADALERLGLLVRYSDAGESAYVHYPH